MALFDTNLGKKPQIIVVNKIDLPQVRSRLLEFEQKLIKTGQKPIFISALARTNLEILIREMTRLINELPEEKEIEQIPIYTVSTDPRHFQIKRISNGWMVTGEAIERAASMTNWEYDESIRRFERILETLGIDKELKTSGVRQGDTIIIGDYELEWYD